MGSLSLTLSQKGHVVLEYTRTWVLLICSLMLFSSASMTRSGVAGDDDAGKGQLVVAAAAAAVAAGRRVAGPSGRSEASTNSSCGSGRLQVE